MIIPIITLIFLVAFYATCAATSCGTIQPCADGSCCSQYGFCGNTAAFCGTGCLSKCQVDANSSSSINGTQAAVVSSFVTDKVFDEFLYKHRQLDCPAPGFYNRSSFLAAAATFPDFGTTGGLDASKKEVAAYFASVADVTDGGCYVEAVNQSLTDCLNSTEWKCASGKKYYGRGPLQVSWNYNYGPMGAALGFDGITNPELVATNPVISFRASLWFWMTTQPSMLYSCHQAILLQSQGFKEVSVILNGGPLDPALLQQRNKTYSTFYALLEATPNLTTVTPAPLSPNVTTVTLAPLSKSCIGSLCSTRKKLLGFVMPLMMGGAVFMVFVSWALWILRYSWHNRERARGNTEKLDELHGLAGTPKSFTYATLSSATKSFTAVLGEGGFGIVYKGLLPNGEVIAVKVLKESLHSDEQFLREIETLGKLHHVNVVRLVGFCVEKSNKILVYEFIPNNSLEKHLFGTHGTSDRVNAVLSWEQRYEIALGVARGLSYMHEECFHKIIHRDMKPHNILLDELFCPKISDFGLAKIIAREESKVMSNLKGTPGYVAPEFWANRKGGLSTKFDVYSFGMVALELVAGRPNLKEEAPSEQVYFPSWAFTNVAFPAQVLDDRIANQADLQQVQVLLLVAMWCIQEESSLRPSMSRIVQYLEGSIEVPPNPPKPFKEAVVYMTNDSSCSSSLPCCESLSEAR